MSVEQKVPTECVECATPLFWLKLARPTGEHWYRMEEPPADRVGAMQVHTPERCASVRAS